MLPVGKGSLTHVVFHPQLGSHKNRHRAWIIPYQEVRESTKLVLDLSPPVGISFSVSNSICVPLFCLRCALYTPGQLHYCFLWGGNRGLLLQHEMVYTDQLPRIDCQERPSGHEEPTPITEADLAMFLLCVRHCFIHCLTALCFPWRL